MNKNQLKTSQLEKAKKFASGKNGECLSSVYVNSDSDLKWKCECGNIWDKSYKNVVLDGRWCSVCSKINKANKKRLSNGIELANTFARNKGGKCLTTVYTSNKQVFEWECSVGHKWESRFLNTVTNKQWCQQCSRKIVQSKLRNTEGLDVANEYAKSQNGYCLTNIYINSQQEILWRCSVGHEWTSRFKNAIYLKQWCPFCSGKKYDSNNLLLLAKKFAIEKHSGECCSNSIKKKTEQLNWKCSNPNHKSWENDFKSIVIDGQWCKECYYDSCSERRRNSNALDVANKYALKRNGFCLSTNEDYINTNSRLKWKCSSGHIWDATYDQVIYMKSWCRICSRNFNSEKRVRLIFETWLGDKLPTVKPEWNRSLLTGKKLELDGYNEFFRFAFEFDGIQHKKKSQFNKSNLDLAKQKYRDYIKTQNCLNNNVTLIRISEPPSKIKRNFFDFLRFVIGESKNQGLILMFTLSQIRVMNKMYYSL